MIKSFSYMFKDSNFLKKFFTLFAFVLTANFLTNLSGIMQPILGRASIWYNIVLIFGYILMFVPYGYSIELLKANMSNLEENNLLDMDIFKNFKDGLKVVLSSLILILSVFILFILFGLFSRLLAIKFGINVSSYIYTFIFLIFLIISFLMIGMCCRYVIKPSWLNFVDFKSVITLINKNVAKYFKVYLMTALLFIILGVLTVISALILTQKGFVGFIIYNIIISLAWTYLTLVFAKLFSFAVEVDKI